MNLAATPSQTEARLRQRITALEKQLDAATDKIFALQETFGMSNSDRFMTLGLTPLESRYLSVLAGNEMCTRDQLLFAMYEGRQEAYDRDPKIVDVLKCKVNQKLAPRGISILSVWGRGQRLSAEDRGKLGAMHA